MVGGCLTSIPDQKTFKACFYERGSGLLDTLPVSAVILEHALIDGKAAVHLGVSSENRIRNS